MRRAQVLLMCAALIAPLGQAHMQMKKPLSRRSKFNPSNAPDQVDYSLSSPLGSSYTFPCRGAPKGDSVASYRAGENIQVELYGQAIHNGGHCQFAVSYDEGKTFVVLRTIMKTCMLDSLKFDVPIPKNAPSSSNVVFAWTWINRTGNREYYMNCADITIMSNQSTGSIVGPKLLVANLPDFPSIPEFPDSGYDGSDLFEKRPIITIRNTESAKLETKSNPATTAPTPSRESVKETATPSSDVIKPKGNLSLMVEEPKLSPLPSKTADAEPLPYGSPTKTVINPNSELEANYTYKLKLPKVIDFLTTTKENTGSMDAHKNTQPFTRVQLKSHPKFLAHKQSDFVSMPSMLTRDNQGPSDIYRTNECAECETLEVYNTWRKERREYTYSY